jgi:hypothetical protein
MRPKRRPGKLPWQGGQAELVSMPLCASASARRAGSRRVTTLPEREFFAIRAAWREMDDGRPYLLLQTTSVGRPSRTHRRASMPPVRAVGRPHCKPPRVCSSSGGSRRIGGISVAPTSLRPPPCRGVMARPGPPSWPGWAKPAIRSWLPACKATTGDGGPEHP